MPGYSTCPCGHNRYHHWSQPAMSYGFLSWVLLFQGATATPRAIEFRCGKCGNVIEKTRDPQVLKQYTRL